MKFRRLLSALMIAAFLPMATTACFGKFNLTRKVYQLNKDVSSDKWVQWLAFLVLSILPIYGIGVWVDVLLLNSIEFWTGENPVTASAGDTRTTYGPNGEVAVATLLEDGAIDLKITETSGSVHSLKLVRELGGISAFDADGRLIANMNGELLMAEGAL